MSQNDYLGFERAGTAGGIGEIGYIVDNLLSKMQTITLVKIENVKGGKTKEVGLVDVKPLVSQVDGANNIIEHGIIYNIPYFRLQGGADAVIIDPKKGDIGLCAFASRDISGVKATKKETPAQSKRMFDFSDGLYIGGFLNGKPEQYIYFNENGITINTAKTVTINANTVINGTLETSGTITSNSDVVASGVSLKNHRHNGGSKPD